MQPPTSLPDISRFFHPVLPAKNLKRRPVRVDIAGRRYALFRDADGRAAAVDDMCPHRAAPLSIGRVRPDGRLACKYHGWHFGADGAGVSPSTQARCTTPSYQVLEQHGYLWLASRETDPSTLTQLDVDGYVLGGTFSTLIQAPIEITLDNFTEDEHFPYIHRFIGWDVDAVPDLEFEAHNREDHTESVWIAPARPTPFLPSLMGLKKNDRFYNVITARFEPVHVVYTSYWFDPASGQRRPVETKVAIFLVPETEKTTRFHTFVFLRIQKDSWIRHITPLAKAIARAYMYYEFTLDARFLPNLADAPPTLEGMRLSRFDKTLVHNRRLLDSLYFRRPVQTKKGALPIVSNVA
jgi:phenylpropionate dioxygenase-like ring-hydroxylating dioxygenase large terminal subunit